MIDIRHTFALAEPRLMQSGASPSPLTECRWLGRPAADAMRRVQVVYMLHRTETPLGAAKPRRTLGVHSPQFGIRE